MVESGDQLQQTFNRSIQLAVVYAANAFSEAFDRDRADLRNLDPGFLWQSSLGEFHGEGKTRTLRLTSDGHYDHGA